MKSPNNMLNMLKMVLPKLKMFGINLNEILQTSLKFLPELFIEKTKEFRLENPDLNTCVMLATKKNDDGKEEVFLIPVGLDGKEIKAQGKAVNLQEFLSQLDIEEMLNSSHKNDENSSDNTNESNLIS